MTPLLFFQVLISLPFYSQKVYCFSMMFYDPHFNVMTFQAWKMELQNYIPFQVFYDLYEPCPILSKARSKPKQLCTISIKNCFIMIADKNM